MLFQSLSIAAVLAALPATLALPNVTAKALPADCSSYPDYNEQTGIAGPWILNLANSDNADIEGWGDSDVYSVANSPTGPEMRWGYITIVSNNQFAKTALQCQDSRLHAYTDTALTAAGAPTNFAWTPLALSSYPYDASLLYLVDGDAPTLYEHYIGDVKQDGYFLGGYNTTTWGVQWQEASGPGSYNQPYFYLRLLPEGQSLQVNETKTFVKIRY
ncbi:hypothetical protein N0V86_006311 [Didymella sp. IMI 355093]|nr:hypothetical protein N0V86_006311 [Didymella sp. IMI 355093]